MSTISRRTILGAGTAGLATTITMPSWAADAKRPAAMRHPKLSREDRAIVEKISPQQTLKNLTELTERIGQRYSGTPAEVRAAKFLAKTLDDYGYDVELQPFPVPDRLTGELSSRSLDRELCWGVGVAANGAQDTRVSGRLVVALSAVPAEMPDVKGAIVLRALAATTEDVTALATAAAAKGAVGFIATRVDSAYPRQASAFAPALTAKVSIPVVGVSQVQKHALLRPLQRGPVNLSLSVTTHRNLTSYNVLATRPTKKGSPPPSSNVMICAHYDSVIGAKGANDDGSGTVLTLELARVMRRLDTRSNLQFALWGSEEVGLVGSRYYVKNLSDAARSSIRGVFNNDMVGTSWDPAEKYWVLSFDGKSNVVNAEVLASGDRLGYRTQMSPVTERGSSDHQSFQEVGVPSGNFSWRGVATPALLEPAYHSSDDTIRENISMERLTVSMEIIGTAAYALARA